MTNESVVIDTGASPGLGGAVARWLAKAGATVLLQILRNPSQESGFELISEGSIFKESINLSNREGKP